MNNNVFLYIYVALPVNLCLFLNALRKGIPLNIIVILDCQLLTLKLGKLLSAHYRWRTTSPTPQLTYLYCILTFPWHRSSLSIVVDHHQMWFASTSCMSCKQMHLKLYDNSLIPKYLHTLKYMHSAYSHKPILAVTVDPNSEDNKFDYLLNGVFTIQSLWDSNYNDTQRAWINTLQCKVPREIDLSLTLEDFKQFFKAKQKCTASSPSSCHMGHYKPCLNVCTTTKPQHMKKMYIAQIVILTIMLLTQWQRASKVMIEIG